MYWLLLVITFTQPYHINHIQILGKYHEKQNCIQEQERVVQLSDQENPVTFSCLQITWKKALSLVPVQQKERDAFSLYDTGTAISRGNHHDLSDGGLGNRYGGNETL